MDDFGGVCQFRVGWSQIRALNPNFGHKTLCNLFREETDKLPRMTLLRVGVGRRYSKERSLNHDIDGHNLENHSFDRRAVLEPLQTPRDPATQANNTVKTLCV